MWPFISIESFFPLNILALIFILSRVKFPLTHLILLDYLFYMYFSLGIIGYIFGLYLIYTGEIDLNQIGSQLKSFIVFLTALIYFGANNIKIKVLMNSLGIVTLLGIIFILIQYIYYIFIAMDYSVLIDRGMVGIVRGWPTKWASFLIVFYFYSYNKIYLHSRKIDIFIFFITLITIILSGTRSAMIAIIIGHFILLVLNKEHIYKLLLLLFLSFFVINEYFYDLFRLNEIFNFNNNLSGSLQYRINIVWPAIIDSLSGIKAIFGWGHLGVYGMPKLYFSETDMLFDAQGDLTGSAESQIFDVLVRQGYIGLLLFFAITLAGIAVNYKLLSFLREDKKSLFFWRTALAWQIAIAFQGITQETVRFPIFGFFYIIFLGVLSNTYRSIVRNDLKTKSQ
jgi:hypothetical protein